jgi:hypothetical protein
LHQLLSSTLYHENNLTQRELPKKCKNRLIIIQYTLACLSKLLKWKISASSPKRMVISSNNLLTI